MNLFDKVPSPKAPKILQLLQDFSNDPRQEKIDLGIGVYKFLYFFRIYFSRHYIIEFNTVFN